MTLDELQSELMVNVETSDEENRLLAFKVLVETQPGEVGLPIKGVRWDHQNSEVILEIE